jgi:hypothetical protein
MATDSLSVATWKQPANQGLVTWLWRETREKLRVSQRAIITGDARFAHCQR